MNSLRINNHYKAYSFDGIFELTRTNKNSCYDDECVNENMKLRIN